MTLIEEIKQGREIIYNVYNKTKKSEKLVQTIRYTTANKELNDYNYLLIYNDDMEPISSAFSFLNMNEADQSINTRLKSQQALKLLFCYESIIQKELVDFTLADINNLKSFLKGYNMSGQLIQFKNLTVRSNNTINGYLSVYRSYLDFQGLNNKYLSDKRQSLTISSTDVNRVERFKTNERKSKNVADVPSYISVEQFQKMIEIIRSDYSIREEIIIRLMFQCGLRIGEVLGLTGDDIVMEKVDDKYISVAYLRNRASDQSFQNAKTVMNIHSKDQYKNNDINVSSYGYQYVVIPEDLYNLINDYIEDVHILAREKDRKNYFKYTVADRIDNSKEYDDVNYYVFLNKWGRPLSQATWNNICRELFKKTGIPLDKGRKNKNLNHRFRHGFAMFNVQYLNCNELELGERLRDTSPASVACYFKPTVQDQIKVKEDFVKSLYDIIPELKKEDIDEA